MAKNIPPLGNLCRAGFHHWDDGDVSAHVVDGLDDVESL